ncbi:hypothetical protein BT93_B0152 [Corymbia citriodora subsp. variegata]|nr:hypothetical protein BT93_B0152 [Corymbia citriodora subsp. variegata]
MAFLLGKSNAVLSHLRSHPQGTEDARPLPPRRGFHVEPGAREKAYCNKRDFRFDNLLMLSSGLVCSMMHTLFPVNQLRACAWFRFKSHKKGVKRLKRIGDVLTIVVVAGCCYEIYVKAVMREEARKQGSASGESA